MKRVIIVYLVGMLSNSALAQSDQAVPTPTPDPVPANASLSNKRAIRKVLAEVLPKAEEKIDASTGRHIPFEIDWNGIARSDFSVKEIDDSIKAVADGLSEIAKDDDGKAAIALKVKVIRLIRGKIVDWEKSITLSEGVLTVPVSEEQFKGLNSSVFAEIVTRLL